MENLVREQPKPSHEEVASLAYQIWEQRGHPQGQDVEFWLEAEQQILSAGTSRSSNSLAVQRRTPQVVAKASPTVQLQTGSQTAVKEDAKQATARKAIPPSRQSKPAIVASR